MSAGGQTSNRHRIIRSGAIGLTLGLAVLAAAVGFVLLPTVEGRTQLQGVWAAICTAAGAVRREPAQDIASTSARTTDVVVTQQIMPPASAQSIGNGATLALRCTMCHGARGLSQADSPNLAGQYATVVYKQLRDYQSGARSNAVMTPIAAGLSEADMRDLAAYYAYLPRLPPNHPASAGPAPAIVTTGAPMRNIAPCGACHGGPDNKAGSAWLEGQPEAYLAAQLHAFATGGRRNDINEQMRNIARRMTPAEIAAAARYYAQKE